MDYQAIILEILMCTLANLQHLPPPPAVPLGRYPLQKIVDILQIELSQQLMEDTTVIWSCRNKGLNQIACCCGQRMLSNLIQIYLMHVIAFILQMQMLRS